MLELRAESVTERSSPVPDRQTVWIVFFVDEHFLQVRRLEMARQTEEQLVVARDRISLVVRSDPFQRSDANHARWMGESRHVGHACPNRFGIRGGAMHIQWSTGTVDVL